MGIYLDYNINNIPEHYKDDCFVMDTLKVKRANIKYHDFHFPLAYRNFILYKNLIRAPFIQRLDVGRDVVLEEDLLFFLKSKFRKGTFHTNRKHNPIYHLLLDIFSLVLIQSTSNRQNYWK